MTADEQQKAAFRRWARENHPDAGGDPEVFAAGLQAAREGVPPGEDSRTTVYVHRSIHGLARVIVAAQKWHSRRQRSPRVR